MLFSWSRPQLDPTAAYVPMTIAAVCAWDQVAWNITLSKTRFCSSCRVHHPYMQINLVSKCICKLLHFQGTSHWAELSWDMHVLCSLPNPPAKNFSRAQEVPEARNTGGSDSGFTHSHVVVKLGVRFPAVDNGSHGRVRPQCHPKFHLWAKKLNKKCFLHVSITQLCSSWKKYITW